MQLWDVESAWCDDLVNQSWWQSDNYCSNDSLSPLSLCQTWCPAWPALSLVDINMAVWPQRLEILSIVVITMPMPSSSNGKQQKPSLYFYEKKCFLVFPSTIQYYKRTRTFSQPFPVKPTKPNVWVKDPSLENDLSHARLCRLSGPERK